MVDRQRVERAAAIVLSLIDQGLVQYTPLLTRLGHELEKLDEGENQIEAMRRRLRRAA